MVLKNESKVSKGRAYLSVHGSVPHYRQETGAARGWMMHQQNEMLFSWKKGT